MKWLPSIPTDNLYKFCAISGLWMGFGLLLFFGWLITIDIQLEKESKAIPLYAASTQQLYKIRNRLDAINDGNTDASRLDWVPKYISLSGEIDLLKDEEIRHKAAISAFENISKSSKISEQLNIFQRTDVMIIVASYISLTVILLLFGFSRWKTQIHDVDMQLRALELEARKLQLKKFRLELATARRARWRASY